MNFSELAPDALTLVSSVGVVAPEVIPELSPKVPAISAAESKLTHLTTPGWAQRVGKSCWPATGGVVTDTVREALAVPPAPLQERLKVVVLVNAPVPSLPEVAFWPGQAMPPVAMQDVASVEDQVSVDDPPLGTDVGVAFNETVGTGGGGGPPCTVTVADAVAVPPKPVQVRENVAPAVSATLDSVPDVALGPTQPPEAAQAVAFVEDQVSIEELPLATVVGFAVTVTVGAG